MKLLVAADSHIFKLKNGTYWCRNIYGYSFWKRYLNVFDTIKIVSRVKEVDSVPESFLRVDGDRVSIFEIPFFRGPKQFLLSKRRIKKTLKNVDFDCDVAIMRMPSQTAYLAYKSLRKNIPVGGEIVFDPVDSLHNSKSFVYKIANIYRINYLKKFCLKANGVSYVTENSIQKHFPSRARIKKDNNPLYFETYYSTITLADSYFDSPRSFGKMDQMTIALTDASMNNDGKGEKTLLKAIQIARQNGFDVRAVIIGDGTMRNAFEQYAEEIGIGEFVRFTGLISSSAQIRDELLKADMYVLPTIAEGLPRGILEAMAVGLPVLSSPVGGIPEIIEGRYLFNPKNSLEFANTICHLFTNPQELSEMSLNNFNRALDFHNDILQKRRDSFYLNLTKLVKTK